MKYPSIISLGEVLWDLFPDGSRFGGAPANFACHAALSEGDVTMVSAVGDDARGREAIRILEGYGIDTGLMQVIADASTGTVGVDLDPAGKPTFKIHENSAWDRIQWNGAIESSVRQADAVYFGTLGQRSELSRNTIRRCVETAAELGTARIVDINLRTPFYDEELIRHSIELASILKLSDDELPGVCSACGVTPTDRADAVMRQVLEFGNLDMVVMTRGADGALLVTADHTIKQSGIPTTVVDTVGAGDAFSAAFLIGELRGETHEQNLRKACEIAARTCGHSGAVSVTQSIGRSSQRID